MTEGKRQHYVPRFYFRFFSEDGINIEIYNIKRKEGFRGPFKHICSENYFYSKNLELEKNLSKIEERLTSVIKKLIEDKDLSKLTTQEHFFLCLFITFQYTRTKMEKIISKQLTNLFVEFAVKPLIRSDIGLKKKGITKEEIDDLKITHPKDHLLKISYGLMDAPLIMNLKAVLLVNRTEKDFVFSDAPVVFHNTFFNQERNYGTTGFQSPGLQIFCPLNNKTMIMLFDENFYEIKHDSNHIVIVESESDIDSLNALQFFNCYENIYFSNKNQLRYIKNLHSKLPDSIKKREIKSEILKLPPRQDGTYSEIFHTFTSSIDYKLTLSFMRLKSGVRTESIVRDTELTEWHRGFTDKLVKEIKKDLNQSSEET